MALQPTAAMMDAINAHKRANKSTRKQCSAPPGPCPACGSKEHWCSECPHKNITCSVCHHMGHLPKVCRDKNSTNNDARRQSQSNPTQQSHKTHLIVRTDQEEDEQLQILATHVTPHHREGAIVHAKLNGHPVNMQLDTGATVTLLGETTLEGIDHTTRNSSHGTMFTASPMPGEVCQLVCCCLQRQQTKPVRSHLDWCSKVRLE